MAARGRVSATTRVKSVAAVPVAETLTSKSWIPLVDPVPASTTRSTTWGPPGTRPIVSCWSRFWPVAVNQALLVLSSMAFSARWLALVLATLEALTTLAPSVSRATFMPPSTPKSAVGRPGTARSREVSSVRPVSSVTISVTV